MTDTEQALRHQVAAVSLLLNAENILGYSGHIPGRRCRNNYFDIVFSLSRLSHDGIYVAVGVRSDVRQRYRRGGAP